MKELLHFRKKRCTTQQYIRLLVLAIFVQFLAQKLGLGNSYHHKISKKKLSLCSKLNIHTRFAGLGKPESPTHENNKTVHILGFGASYY